MMKYYFIRLDKNFQENVCECRFFLHSKGEFIIYFDKPTPAIILNDGNTHEGLTELRGTVVDMFIDNDGIHLRPCFLQIGKQWHKDGISLNFRP